jgi:hypothetical protein
MAAFERPPENPWTRLVVGGFILATGVVMWLDRIGRIDASDYTRWWPLALVAMGLAHLPRRQWVGAAIWMGIGFYLLAPLLGLPRFSVRYLFGLWPILIAIGGLTLVMQALKKETRDVSAVAVMGGNERMLRSDNFVGGDVVAVMGGCEINLANASFKGEAVIDVLAFWGGIELTVPRGWSVTTKVVALLGGVTNGASPAPAGAPQLIVRGSAIMGGIEVKQAAEEAI